MSSDPCRECEAFCAYMREEISEGMLDRLCKTCEATDNYYSLKDYE